MISRILISASAGIILFFGSVHLAYTFLTHKFSPTEKQLETAMKQVAPRISREATMWKVWIGIHVSHSMGLVMFGLIYGYLALSRWDVLLRSHFLMGLGLLWLVGYILLAQIYWFRIPLIGVSLATLLYLAGLVGIFAPNEDLSSTEGISRLENPKAQTAPGELHWRSHLRQLDTSNMAGCSQITCR